MHKICLKLLPQLEGVTNGLGNVPSRYLLWKVKELMDRGLVLIHCR